MNVNLNLIHITSVAQLLSSSERKAKFDSPTPWPCDYDVINTAEEAQ